MGDLVHDGEANLFWHASFLDLMYFERYLTQSGFTVLSLWDVEAKAAHYVTFSNAPLGLFYPDEQIEAAWRSGASPRHQWDNPPGRLHTPHPKRGGRRRI
jgi:hypothetical protein